MLEDEWKTNSTSKYSLIVYLGLIPQLRCDRETEASMELGKKSDG